MLILHPLIVGLSGGKGVTPAFYHSSSSSRLDREYSDTAEAVSLPEVTHA